MGEKFLAAESFAGGFLDFVNFPIEPREEFTWKDESGVSRMLSRNSYGKLRDFTKYAKQKIVAGDPDALDPKKYVDPSEFEIWRMRCILSGSKTAAGSALEATGISESMKTKKSKKVKLKKHYSERDEPATPKPNKKHLSAKDASSPIRIGLDGSKKAKDKKKKKK